MKPVLSSEVSTEQATFVGAADVRREPAAVSPASAAVAPVIDVRGLRYCYPDGTQALENIDFQLQPGECVAVFGPNGSGKTTFTLHLNGLLRGEGFVEVCGVRLDGSTGADGLAKVRAHVGLVFQNSDEQLFMPTVLEDVAFGPANLGFSPEEAASCARAALDQVGMSDAAGKAPYHLSAGEKRRVALAGVLAMQPRILVLDEPTTSLDPPGQRGAVSSLARLAAGQDSGNARRRFCRRSRFPRRILRARPYCGRRSRARNYRALSVVSRIRVTGPSFVSSTSMWA